MSVTANELNADELISAIKGGESLLAVAERFNTNAYQVRKRLTSAGTSIREIRPTLLSRIESLFPQWKEAGLSIKQAADEMGISQQHLSGSLLRLGLTLSDSRKTSVKQLPTSEVGQKASEVLQILMTKGGSLKKILRDAGLKNDEAAIRKELRRRGIDPGDYYYAHRRYGDWLVLPGTPISKFHADRLLPCRCLNCGAEEMVLYSNLVSARSTMCKKCAMPGQFEVVDLKTGEIFSSIRKAVRSLGLLSKYQTIRLTLLKSGEFTHEGHTLQLRKEDETNV